MYGRHWARHHQSSNDSVQYGPATPSVLSSSTVWSSDSMCLLLYQQRYISRRHRKVHSSQVERIPFQTIMGISWLDHMANDEVLKRAMLQPLSDIVKVRRWTLRDTYYAYARGKAGKCSHEPVSRKQKQGRPQKTWWTTFKEGLQAIRVTWRGAKKSCQWPQPVEETRRPISQTGREELSLSLCQAHVQRRRGIMSCSLHILVSCNSNTKTRKKYKLGTQVPMRNVAETAILRTTGQGHQALQSSDIKCGIINERIAVPTTLKLVIMLLHGVFTVSHIEKLERQKINGHGQQVNMSITDYMGAIAHRAL